MPWSKISNQKNQLESNLRGELLKKDRESRTSRDKRKKRWDLLNLRKLKTLSIELSNFMRKSKSLRSRKFKFTRHYKRLMRKSEKFKPQLITLRMPGTESTKGDMNFNSETFITSPEMPMQENLTKESNLRSTLEESKIDMKNSRTPANHQE